MVRHWGRDEESKREIGRKPGSVVSCNDWPHSSKGKTNN